MRLTSSVVQPMSCNDLLTFEAIGSNYLSFVVTLLLASTTPLAEAGTAASGFGDSKIFNSNILVKLAIAYMMI